MAMGEEARAVKGARARAAFVRDRRAFQARLGAWLITLPWHGKCQL